MISGKCKATPEQIHADLNGELNPMQAEKLSLIRQQIDNINALKAALEKLIFEIAAKYQPQIDLLMTIPGISTPLTAIRILAEIGADMSVFETAKQLTSWAGLTPQNQESASKKKATRIGRAEAYLKPLFVQIALNCGKSDKSPLKNQYLALKKRRGGKKAVIEISRKLLTAIWYILSKNQAYNADLYHKADRPPLLVNLLPHRPLTFCATGASSLLTRELAKSHSYAVFFRPFLNGLLCYCLFSLAWLCPVSN